MTTATTTKYFAYVRKSTEGEERQALSIESQRDKVKEFFSGLEIVDIMEEKHSAFSPYNRPVFAEMIKRIRKGEAEGIIAWHPDRLSRNEIDASTISYLVRTGVIKDLKFGSYNFDNSPEGIMMLQLALSQSQYFSSKLGKDVRRGLEKKFSMGWLPNKAPEGYLNKQDENNNFSIIVPDPERSPLLRRAFDLMLTGNYSVPEILEKMNKEWGYKTRKIRSLGGKELSRSAIYRVFTNPFYAGIINYSGQETKGKHKRLITVSEYDQIQTLLGRNGKPRRQEKDFPYRGLIKCKECGCLITADFKTKLIKKTGQSKVYAYYYCAHRRRDYSCKQSSVDRELMDGQIIDELRKYELNHAFLDLGLEIIDELKLEETAKDELIKTNVGKSMENLKEELKSLTKMKYRDLLSDEEYLEAKNELGREIARLNDLSGYDEIKEEKVLKLTKQTFELACHGLNQFINGDSEKKREILSSLGSNFFLEDKKLEILAFKWLLPIEKNRELLNAKFATFELTKNPIKKGRNELLDSLRPVLRRAWYYIGTLITTKVF